jgi:pilus assembly protein CpaF
VIAPTSTAKAPLFSVIVHEKGGTERRETFQSDELTVGRVQGNELMLPKGNVSKRHARLLYRDGRFIVTDLNSTNGTYVNRRKITQATIVREGDRIYIGDFVLRIEMTSAPASDGGSADHPEPARAPLTTVSDSSNSGLSARPHEPDSDERFRGSLPLKSSPSSSSPSSADTPPRFDPPVEVTGTHSAPSLRVARDDRPDLEAGSLRDIVRTLVERVAARLSHVDLMAPVPPSLGERIDEFLHQAWSELGTGREIPSSVPADRALELARAELVEHGPLSELLADPGVSAIGVSRFDRVVATRGGRVLAFEPGFSSDLTLRWAIARLCAESGAPIGAGEQMPERRLGDGAHLSALLGAQAQSGACVSIRKAVREQSTLEELVRSGAISRAMSTFLQQCLQARVNLLIVGPRDGSVDALLSACAQAVSDGSSVFLGERVLAGFDVSLRASTPKELEQAWAVASGLPGARIVADLERGELCARVVEAVADGSDGVVALRVAPSLKRALARLPGVISAVRLGMSLPAARELVANAFELVVEVARLRDDRVRVLRIAELTGVSGEEIQLQDVFTFVADRRAAGGSIEGTFNPSGSVPQLVEGLRARGIAPDTSVFSRPPSR